MSTPIAVGGCDPKDPEDPGNLQLDWLEVQLTMFRRRGMQVCAFPLTDVQLVCGPLDAHVYVFVGVDIGACATVS